MATLTSAGMISMKTNIGAGTGGALISVLLILLLSAKELMSSSTFNSPNVGKALNLALLPLLILFALDVAYMVMM